MHFGLSPNADSDPAYPFDADPDPAYHSNADGNLDPRSTELILNARTIKTPALFLYKLQNPS
jgi:hypothetical protein